jgi:hypothetical protein
MQKDAWFKSLQVLACKIGYIVPFHYFVTLRLRKRPPSDLLNISSIGLGPRTSTALEDVRVYDLRFRFTPALADIHLHLVEYYVPHQLSGVDPATVIWFLLAPNFLSLSTSDCVETTTSNQAFNLPAIDAVDYRSRLVT